MGTRRFDDSMSSVSSVNMQSLIVEHLTNKKAKTVLCSVIKHARKWREHERSVGWTRAAGECFSVPLECSYNIALLTFVKKLALICKKTSFIHSLHVQARARKVVSLPARAEWCHGLPRASVLCKARCFNQSERALYRNFSINRCKCENVGNTVKASSE